jgi:hypothetical protein
MTGRRRRRSAREAEFGDGDGDGDEDNILRGETAEPGGLLLPEDEPVIQDDLAVPKDAGDIGRVSDEPMPDPATVFDPDDVGIAT